MTVFPHVFWESPNLQIHEAEFDRIVTLCGLEVGPLHSGWQPVGSKADTPIEAFCPKCLGLK